jgi:hypothetical protein
LLFETNDEARKGEKREKCKVCVAKRFGDANDNVNGVDVIVC